MLDEVSLDASRIHFQGYLPYDKMLDVMRISSAHIYLTVPFVLFALFRYHHLVETAGLGERPEEAFQRDRTLQVCVLAFLALSLTAIYLDR